MADFNKYPICDTDIWVNLCLGGIVEDAFRQHKKLVVADVVKGEIFNWRNGPFSQIATLFTRYESTGELLVIVHARDILEPHRKMLERQLYDIGFSNDFKNRPPEDSKGEFVSAIYADYFGIPLMKTNDGAFREGGKGSKLFPDLVIKDWNATLRDLIPDHAQRIKINATVEQERRRMDEVNRQYNSPLNPSDLVVAVEQLRAKFCR